MKTHKLVLVLLIGLSLPVLAASKRATLLTVQFETTQGTLHKLTLKPNEKRTVQVDGVKYTVKASSEAALKDPRDPGATIEPQVGKLRVLTHERITIDERK
ncbi:hypothetical protein [Chitinimonas lacunae]|uniref:Uncharacterized protein n=1 Tax=Chitinimonas lacunae TaxID=1963018 RepID=A0ABV8MPG1_9NEIS